MKTTPQPYTLSRWVEAFPANHTGVQKLGVLNKRNSNLSIHMPITVDDCCNKVVVKGMTVNCRSQHFLEILTVVLTEATEAHYC